MRGNKRLVQGIAVAGAAGVLVFSVTFSQPQIMQTEGTIQIAENGTAGIMAALNPTGYMGDILTKTVTVANSHMYQVSAGISASAEKFIIDQQAAVTDERASIVLDDQEDEYSRFAVSASATAVPAVSVIDQSEDTTDESDTDDKNTNNNEDNINKNNTTENTKEDNNEKSEDTKNAEEEKQTEKQKKWANKLIADVDDYLNIRSASNESSKVVGKLRKGDVAKIIKKGKTWTKIKSGSVTGYVNNEYCVYGTKAYKLAKKTCNTYATVQANGLRIRKQANKNATVLDAAFKGDRLVVNTKAKQKDGWVVVNFDGQKGYVSEKFVKVALGNVAISIEEEKAQIAAAQKTAVSSSSSSSNTSTAASSSTVSTSDLTLLSAIIFCEAGGESYSGQVAVGAVVMNRVKSSSFPNSISGVVYQSGQFSPVANGALARALSNGSYKHCVSAAQAALAGNDNTGGAKFFHRANGAAGLIIGNHVFY